MGIEARRWHSSLIKQFRSRVKADIEVMRAEMLASDIVEVWVVVEFYGCGVGLFLAKD
jgi:hypothetical protein